MDKIPIIAVCGATASGKTGLAVEIAKRVNGEIVSADSMQIYKYMNIGTAKPTLEEMSGIAHHMIDCVEPSEPFTVADYTEQAHRIIADITSRKKRAIIAGGTGLYINSVINDVDFGEIETDEEYRKMLADEVQKNGAVKLWEKLKEIDPKTAEEVHYNNVKRVIRALEYYKTTGKKISEHKVEDEKRESRYNPLMLAIEWDRDVLYDRINRRVDIMLESGLMEEIKSLRDMGYTADMNSMQGIGYKEFLLAEDGIMTYDEARELVKQSSRRYAKRQLTWFRRDKRIHWLKSANPLDEAMELIERNGFS